MAFNPMEDGARDGIFLRDWLQSIAIDQPPQTTITARVQQCGAELLNSARLQAFGSECELLEIEYYFHSVRHPDPFAHRSKQQAKLGYWYLHRQGSGGFKSGSFKGLDFTFGSEIGGQPSYGGILIRSMRAASGEVINGSSLCVDHLLALGNNQNHECSSVAALHERIGETEIWSQDNPVRLALAPSLARNETEPQEPVYATARVGLTLKRVGWRQAEPYLLRRYRFHRSPKDIKKGRVQTILAMSADGLPPDEIQRRTRSPKKSIEQYLRWAKSATGTAADYEGCSMSTQQLCELWGLTETN